MAKYRIIPSSRTIVQSPISIGHKAEKGVEAIEFDLTAWVETYGSGTLTVIMRRWGDAIPYPIALEIDENNKATWVLSDTDTARAGMAYAQLSYIVGETVVKKSDIYTFRVMDSLTGEGDPPEAYESWLEHLTHIAAEAMAEVLDIEGVATDKTLTVDGGIADAKATGEALAEKVDAADYSELSARVGANTIALAEKADRSTTYTKTEVDGLIEDVTVETDTTLAVSGAPADAKKVGDELSDIKADLSAKTGVINLIKDYYIKTSDTPIDLTPMSSTAGRTYAVVDCSPGDKFVINAYSDFPAARTWCFIDNANNAVSMADANATVIDLELTAPENAVKLIINDISGGMSYKVGNNLGSKVIALDLAVKTMEHGLSNDAKEALLTCFKYVAWSDVHGRDYYDALERALYVGIDLPVVYWNYSLGRVPSNDDMITTNTTGSKSITFNQNLGMYITGGSSSDNVIFAPTEYPTCKKAYIEITFTITTIEGIGSFAVRLSNGVSGYNCSMGMVSVNNVLVFRMMYQTGDNYETVIIPKFTPEFNTEYRLRVEYENGGTNKIYINDALLHETQEVTTKWTTANRVMVVGGVSVYIKNMKWGIEEV